MEVFYGNKIKNREIHPKTGKIWKLADVPIFWRNKTNSWLENN